MRLSKLIAISGIASRRAAEKIILDGRVTLNNKAVTDLITFVGSGDKVIVDGHDISQWLQEDFANNETRLWLFHKPRGVITSRSDPQCRTTLFSLLPKNMQNLISIGRLDFNTEGLILLTNNGRLSRFFELPSNEIKRVYRVKAHGKTLSSENIKAIKQGLVIDGFRYQGAEIVRNCSKWSTITIKEGKNREIRKIFEYFDMQVSRLIRLEYGEFKLESLAVGQFSEVDRATVQSYVKKLL